jgi:ABC-type amino acid transport substrate-binding protein
MDEPKPKRVVICQDGTLGAGHYDAYVLILKEGMTTVNPTPEVEVVETSAEALQRVQQGRADIVVFVSVGMMEFARQIRRQYPDKTVFVLTGVDPEGQPYVLPKLMVGPAVAAAMI